jgi:hypothetical protein
MTEVFTKPVGPALAPPSRRSGSVRRTSTILMTWPDGILSGLQLEGRCRDLLTDSRGAPVVLREDEMTAIASLDRTIESISSRPSIDALDAIVGARAGGKLRGALDQAVPDLRQAGAPLYLLLDDLAGASLIAGFAWFRWRDQLPELQELRGRIPVRTMEGVCSGFRPGASSLRADGTQSEIPQKIAVVPPLADVDDPLGWHDLGTPPDLAMRRARRVDVWPDGDDLRIDAMFRDSCWEPDGTEVAVHEYQIDATASGGRLTSVIATPRVLPYDECPGAAPNAARLVGVPLDHLRTEVLARLRATDCCTHLNDALRSLAEVPTLARSLR